MKETNTYGTINDSQPLINKPSNKSGKGNYAVFMVGILMLIAMIYGLFHTNSYHSTNSNLLSSDGSVEREYTVGIEICDLQYAGDSALNDEFYLSITTAEGTSEPTQMPQAEMERGNTFEFTITASLGLDVRSATITTEALDAICVDTVSITVNDESFTSSDNVEWISNNCDETTTLRPCSDSVTFEFKYYYISSGFGDWTEVRASCQADGGDLAMFDGETIDRVYELCEAAVDDQTGKSCYVGFDDFATLNEWEWLNDEAFDLYDYVADNEFHTSSWDRCGCISMRYTEAKPLADCTCDFSAGLYGVCQSEAIDGASTLTPPISPRGTRSMDETRPNVD